MTQPTANTQPVNIATYVNLNHIGVHYANREPLLMFPISGDAIAINRAKCDAYGINPAHH